MLEFIWSGARKARAIPQARVRAGIAKTLRIIIETIMPVILFLRDFSILSCCSSTVDGSWSSTTDECPMRPLICT
jgi:hypothetical protein